MCVTLKCTDMSEKSCTGSLIGFTNLGDINRHFIAYEHKVLPSESDEPLAQSMLVLMVRGLFNSLEFPYANFHAMRSLEINCMLHFGKLWVVLSYVGLMACL